VRIKHEEVKILSNDEVNVFTISSLFLFSRTC
jgi:hypothetical protein